MKEGTREGGRREEGRGQVKGEGGGDKLGTEVERDKGGRREGERGRGQVKREGRSEGGGKGTS